VHGVDDGRRSGRARTEAPRCEAAARNMALKSDISYHQKRRSSAARARKAPLLETSETKAKARSQALLEPRQSRRSHR